ncbi:MAG: DUF1320 domain-containing protein [Spirochaetota bacterium]
MAYCAQTDIELSIPHDVLVELSDDPDDGEVVAAVITRAVADADAEIDAYAGQGGFSIPFSTVPARVRTMSVDLAICYLYARRSLVMPEQRAEACNRARSFLEDLAAGKVGLGAGVTMDSNDGPEASTDVDDRVFTTGRESDSFTGTLDDF